MDLSGYNLVGRLAYQLEPRLARGADAVVVNSRSGTGRALSAGFPAARLRTIWNGIDTNLFRPNPSAGLAFRDRIGVDRHRPLIGVASRIDVGKGHETFIAAAAEVHRVAPLAQFVCIGGGSSALTQQLKRLAVDLSVDEAFTWTGHEADMASVYPALDVACSPSAGESFPNTVAEAMACGVPAVVTDVGDSAVIVGETGLVVPAGDPTRLAAALLAGLSTAGERGPSVRERVLDEFSVDRMIDQVERLIWSLVGPSAGP